MYSTVLLYIESVLILFSRDKMMFQILRSIQLQVRQNTIILKKLIGQSGPPSDTNIEQFSLPMETDADIDNVESLLADKGSAATLVSLF